MTGRLTVEISRVSDAWASAPPAIEATVRQAADSAWAAVAEDRTGDGAELSVVLADDATIRRLNRDYRGRDTPTNVLAFPAGDEGAPGRLRLLGDIVIAFETLRREAEARAITPLDHVSHLVVHGMLHLLGHDHRTESEAAAMEALEAGILAGLGVADPYVVAAAAAD